MLTIHQDRYKKVAVRRRLGECYQWGYWTRLTSATAGDSLMGSSPTFSVPLSRDKENIDKRNPASYAKVACEARLVRVGLLGQPFWLPFLFWGFALLDGTERKKQNDYEKNFRRGAMLQN